MIRLFYLTVVLGLAICCSSTAQQNKQITKQQLGLLPASTLYVVFDDNLMAYNVAIKSAIEKNWKLTSVKFIQYAEFEQLRAKKANSFLLLTRTVQTKDKRHVEYMYMNILMGDSVENINDLPEVLTLPIANSATDDAMYGAVMPALVRFAQNHVSNMLKANKLNSFFNLKNYSDSIVKIKTQTLLVAREDLGEDVPTIEKIKESYPYEVKVVSRDDIAKAIDEKTPNTLFVYIINPGEDGSFGRSYKMVFSAAEGQMYFYYFLTIYSRQPAGFMARDFKRISGKW
jgi:hypothetical protein